ncbi:hypothetical protein FDECE_3491 [Fusarium decemcellulare]|nr:hypothetical protein FDECE_3491 [Fusarium decemcellulare]
MSPRESNSTETFSRPVSPLTIDEEPTEPAATDAGRCDQKERTTVTESLLPKAAEVKPQRQSEGIPRRRTGNNVLADTIVALIALGAMSVSFWMIFQIKFNTGKGFIDAATIGGRFSSSWAKLVDAGCSIVLAPTILAAANWYIFKLVRLCAVNQDAIRDRPISLKALAELAGTDWGSYSLLKHWTFIHSRNPRLCCLAFVTVLSAVSFSFLTNVTAYRARGFRLGNSTQQLEALFVPGDSDTWNTMLLDFSQDQWYELFSKLRDSLQPPDTQLPSVGVSDSIRLNVSKQSYEKIASSARRVFNIPAYQLNTTCKPSKILDLEVLLEGNTAEFHMNISSGQGPSSFQSKGHNWQLLLSGRIDNAKGLPHPLMVFGDEETWIGLFYVSEGTGSDLSLKYGDLEQSTFQGNEEDFNGTSWTFYGVTCTLGKAMGQAAVSRKAWSIARFQPDSSSFQTERQTPILRELQTGSIFDLAAMYETPGIGAHIAQAAVPRGMLPDELPRVVAGFAWLEAEARNIVADVAGVSAAEDLDFEVVVEAVEQLYAITYVPWILLTGLLALGTASLLAIGLALDFLQTPSLRNGRMLSPVQLIMDVGAALDKDEFEEAVSLDRDELDAWVETVKLRYEAEVDKREGQIEDDSSYRCVMRLRRITRPEHDG